MARSYNLNSSCERGVAARNDAAGDWYLIASCAYYEYDVPLFTDAFFDGLCRHLLTIIDGDGFGPDFGYDPLIIRDNLTAGTCLGVKYPAEIREAARGWIEVVEKGRHYNKRLQSEGF